MKTELVLLIVSGFLFYPSSHRSMRYRTHQALCRYTLNIPINMNILIKEGKIAHWHQSGMKPAPIRSQFGEYVLLSSYNNV